MSFRTTNNTSKHARPPLPQANFRRVRPAPGGLEYFAGEAVPDYSIYSARNDQTRDGGTFAFITDGHHGARRLLQMDMYMCVPWGNYELTVKTKSSKVLVLPAGIFRANCWCVSRDYIVLLTLTFGTFVEFTTLVCLMLENYRVIVLVGLTFALFSISDLQTAS